MALPFALLVAGNAAAADCTEGDYTTAATCTLPTGITQVKMEAWGGGAGGSFGDSTETGSGGGGGSYCGATFTLAGGTPLTISPGAGGATQISQVDSGGQSSVTGTGVVGLAANGGSPGANGLGGLGGTTAACTATSATAHTGGAGYRATAFSNNGATIGGGGGGGVAEYFMDGNPSNGRSGGYAGFSGGSGGNGALAANDATPGSAPGGGGGGGNTVVVPPASPDGRNGGAGRVKLTFLAPPAPQIYSASSPTGSGTIRATISCGGGTCGFASSSYQLASNAGGTPPAGVSFPHGVLNFTTNTIATGGTINVTITYPQALPTGAKFYKYGPATAGAPSTWYEHTPYSISQDRLSISYSVTDGGQGDSSATAGVITDPAGAAVPVPSGAGVTSVPTLSEWGLIALAGLMALLGLKHTRRRKQVF